MPMKVQDVVNDFIKIRLRAPLSKKKPKTP
jgi:hypothetical protein